MEAAYLTRDKMSLSWGRLKKGSEIIRDRKVTAVLLVVSLILTSGILAYNIDSIYASNRTQLKAVMPSDYSGGESVKFPALVNNLNGEPQEEEKIEVYLERGEEKKETLLYEGRTSKEGMSNVEFELPEGDYEGALVVKSSGKTIRRNVDVRGEKRLFVSTDKPIYQPGQTVHIRSLCFEGDEPLDESHQVTYTIKSPEGDKIFRKDLHPDEFGISYLNYTLSDLLPLGAYELKVSSGEKTVKEKFLVDEYVLPRFKINFRGLKDWYLRGDDLSATLEAEYFFGKDVEGEVSVALQSGDRIVDTSTGTLEDGQFPFYFEDIDHRKDHFTLNATVTDTSGHQEWDAKDVPIASSPLDFEFVSTKNMVDTASVFTLRLTHPDGSAVEGVEVSGKVGDTSLPARTTGEGGTSEWEVDFEGQETVTFSVEYKGKEFEETFDISQKKGVKILPTEGGNRIDESKRFQVYYRGESMTDRIYYSVQTQSQVLYSDYFVMDERPYTLSIPVVYEMAPEYRINAYAVEKNLSFSSDTYTGKVSQGRYLDLDISTGKEMYRPGEPSQIDFNVSKRGEPTRTAIGVTITDESISELNQLSGMDEVLTKEKEEPPEEGKGYEVVSAGQTMQDVHSVKNEWVSNYWSSLILAGLVSAAVLFLLSLRYKPVAACLVAGILIVSVAGISITSLQTEEETTRDTEEAGERAAGDEDAAADGGVLEGLGSPDEGEKTEPRSTEEKEDGEEESTETRTHFPETWYWNPTLITDEDGRASLNLTTPDSITNWMVEGVTSTKKGEMVGNETGLKVFKQFFVEPDIPVSAVRGDRFSLRVMVYNYLNESVDAQVSLENSDWFTLHENETKYVELEPESVGSVHYNITAKTVGKHEISIIGSAGEHEDIIKKIMRVKPNGEKQVDVFNGQLTNQDMTNISFTPDEDYVPGGQKAYAKLYGSMDSVTLDSAEGFIHQVSGCGEQSMSTLSVDVLAFDIASSSENPPQEMEKYEKIVTQGLQHELTFLKEAKNGEGRGIVWFPSDEDVHPWLTSWGLITFQDAQNAGFMLDDAITKDMQKWLVSQQDPNGSWEFPERGLYETTSGTLKSKKVATTAYVVRSLLYSGYDPSSEAVKDAVDYIKGNIKQHWEDPYTLSISALAMKLADEEGSLYREILGRIDGLKKVENKTCHWEANHTALQSGGPELYASGGGNSVYIETTGYAIMALAGEGYVDTTDMAVQYLLNNRNQFGTFFSTQDTVVALQSLQATSSEIELSSMNITVEMNGDKAGEVNFDEDNKDLTYLIDLRDYMHTNETNNVTITTKGEGKLAYTVVYEEYVGWAIDPREHISLETDTASRAEVEKEYNIEMELAYEPSAGYSKMGLIEIPLPTGFATVNYDYLLEKKQVSNWEIKEDSLLIYLTDMNGGDEVDLNVKFIPTRTGEIQIQGINYYDMYSPSRKVEIDPTTVVVES